MHELLTRDGTRIVYEKNGKGSPLIKIHGFNMNLATFNSTIEKFSDNYTVYTIDLRGHGKSDKPQEITIQQHINDVIDLMNAEGMESAHILGHDIGAVIAQELAIQYPSKVRDLILVSPISNKGKQPIIKLIAKHRDKVAGFSKEEAMLILFSEIFYDVDSAFKWYQDVRKYYRMSVEQDAISVRSINGINIESNKVDVPTLIIKGKHDPFVVDDGSEVIKNAQLEIFNHSGHAPFIEESNKFKEVVTSFLARVDASEHLIS
ncbi:alpha/beta fold hydrolase [Mammaliicoccus stepanovicii]|uniref:Alpha/beta hydrolase n=1 Tax=Mammaliicoccus stepanovicii TaxID=643214 RepID=A0A240A7U2_9STAP|nr:alpha/beta hydrolase [Mammaliicoccus stepanovicii]PNZ77183.1 alpha/beta hydrolase [Mammaliicoccus stepanovicii]GGI39633.1 alpha/beta hydrolase [Mammaliicoccus stepanovicii]SNV79144.1 alpha/beta hydrolase [Mammaliicoccus stepanovicii]